MDLNGSDCRRVAGVGLTRRQNNTIGSFKQADFSRFIWLIFNRIVTGSFKAGNEPLVP
jgi:hypothetical protein